MRSISCYLVLILYICPESSFALTSSVPFKVEYFLSNTATEEIQTLFHVSPQNGVIKLISPLDREQASRHTFEVEARDQGAPPLVSKVAVMIEVMDYNDNPPVFGRRRYSAAGKTNLLKYSNRFYYKNLCLVYIINDFYV